MNIKDGNETMAYTKEGLKKYVEQTKALFNEKMEMFRANETSIKMHFSSGNRKIGRVLNVSTSPVIACGNCKNCMGFCYDIKANLQYGNVRNARVENTILAIHDRDRFFGEIDKKMSRRKKNKYFRYHVAGDILDYDYFCRMVKTAIDHPDFIIWTYTKMYFLVNQYIRENGKLPDNFRVMFSEWDGMAMANPYGMPIFSCRLKDGNKNRTAEQFESMYKCPGNCDICKTLNRGCVAGESSYADEH